MKRKPAKTMTEETGGDLVSFARVFSFLRAFG
jgi:hypothetical protein